MTGAAFLLLALTLVVAAGNWLAVEREHKALEYVCKPLTMVLLIGVALALDVADPTVRAWFIAALVLSLAGDVFLMLPRDLFGLAAFLLGHIAYIIGMQVDGVDVSRVGVGIVIVALGMAVVGVPIVNAVRGSAEIDMAGPVVAYMLVISAMVASAFGTGHVLAVLGALSFYASDALIAWNRFVTETPHHRLAIMVTYHLGQMGLVLSLI